MPANKSGGSSRYVRVEDAAVDACRSLIVEEEGPLIIALRGESQ